VRNALFVLALAAASLLACKKKEEATTTTSGTAPPASASVAPSATVAVSTVDVSAEMKGFMDMLDGSDRSTGKALEKYGGPSVQENERGRGSFGIYSLRSPKVTKSEKLGVMQCYTMESESGKSAPGWSLMKHETKICWDSEGKIAQLTSKDELRAP
jgi:hypothetical protein